MMARWRAALVLFVLVLAPFSAWAQGALLQGGTWTPGHAPMYVGQGSSQAVVQDSGPASGGGAGLGLSEQLLTVRGTGTAPYANAGTGPNGTNWCDYDAPITNATGYHFICIGPNNAGGALLDVGFGGGATGLPFSIIVNGITYPFPGALSTITIGTTPVTGGSSGSCLYVNGSTVGQQTCTLSAITALTGDITATGPGSAAATLATVNANVGTFGSTANTGVFTVNAKGQITAATNVAIGVTIGSAPIVGGANSNLLYNNGGVLGNLPVASFLANGTGINITGTTTATINCKLATSSVTGCVEGDGATITLTAGVVSCTTATSSQIGCVEPDGTIITDTAGAITVAKATSGAFGVIEGDGSTVTLTSGVLKCTTATTSQLGCVKPDGSTITISGGVISSTASASSVTVGTTTIVSGTTGYLLYSNGGTLGNEAISSIAVTTLNGSSGPATAVTSVATNNGITGGTITNTGTIGRALNEATANLTASATSTFTNTSAALQAGLGGTYSLTPVYGSRIHATIYGTTSNATANDYVQVALSFGTGGAPSFGAAATGSICSQQLADTSPTANAKVAFSLTCMITGLSHGTAYWFDLQEAVNAGTGTIQATGFAAFEY